MRYKVCVYAICKNEEQFVDRWMAAVNEADSVVVLDTGSTDSTVKKLRAAGATVYEQTISPWRFDTARNIAMDHIPEDFDICVSNDLDEVFETGWRKKLEDAWQRESTRARYLFVWSHNEDGSIAKTFPMEKIHRRRDFRWVHPVHEVLEYSGSDPESVPWVDGLVLHHYPDDSKPRSQYLPLLELSAEENPYDSATVFWLGREYMYYGMHDQCISTLTRHLDLPSEQWAVERCASMRFIADCYKAKGEKDQRQAWLYRAIAECPNSREPYNAMALLGYEEEDWPLVLFMAKKALEITNNISGYLSEPACWDHSLYDFACIATYWMGLYQDSYDYGTKAVEMSPHDQRLVNNVNFALEKLNANKDRIGSAVSEGASLPAGEIIDEPILQRFYAAHFKHFYTPVVQAGDLCFDVGANIGSRTSALLELGAVVVAVEPRADLFRDLLTTFQTSAATGMFYAVDEGFTLDALINRYGVPKLCKIDVEQFGYETIQELNYPIHHVVLEFNTLAQLRDSGVRCVTRLDELGYYEFNYAVMDDNALKLDIWVSADAMRKIILNEINDAMHSELPYPGLDELIQGKLYCDVFARNVRRVKRV